MRIKQFLLAVASAACVVSPAFAEDVGFYAGGALGQSRFQDPGCNNSPGITFTSCGDTDTGIKVFGGYQFTRNWGAEVTYVDFGKVTATAIVVGIPVNAQVKANGFQLAGVGTLPLENKFSIFGKAGIFLGHLDSSASGGGVSVSLSGSSTTLSYGVGARWELADRVAARLEFEQFKKVGDSSSTGTSDINLISVGLSYRF